MPETTAETFGGDGWLRTNGLVVMDENGYFKITGRISDMFIVGGMNAYPAEIEDHIAKNSKVAQLSHYWRKGGKRQTFSPGFISRLPRFYSSAI